MHQTLTVEQHRDLLGEVVSGLLRREKLLPCKMFYDARGSLLFDRICQLEEYYPTRTESSIMSDNIEEIARLFPPRTLFVEFGSGSSTKTRLILDHIHDLTGYIPIDISEEHLELTARDLRLDYPGLNIHPLPADYTKALTLPDVGEPYEHVIVYFPGSTIGNFTRSEARLFLREISSLCGDRGGLLIGVDLKKDISILERAYDDAEGVTAQFNLNVLRHLNEEFRSDFNPDNFRHFAFYNEPHGRIEMHLVSLRDQEVHLGEHTIHFMKNEHILTEHSHKYDIDEFARLCGDFFIQEKVWTDPDNYFSVQYLTAVPSGACSRLALFLRTMGIPAHGQARPRMAVLRGACS